MLAAAVRAGCRERGSLQSSRRWQGMAVGRDRDGDRREGADGQQAGRSSRQEPRQAAGG